MNADRLMERYEQIADAPDAIARLRRFILDLAVRGKLVPQDANDEPASELLERIAKEKARLVRAGEIRNEKPLASAEDDAPFDIPGSWRWTRLGMVTSYIQRGKSPKYAASDGSLVVSQKCVQWRGLDLSVAKQVTIESLADYEEIRFLRDGDLVWNSTGTGTIGRVVRLVDTPEKLVCDSHVTVVRCLEVDPEYIRTWLRSDHVYALIEERAAGSTNQVELTTKMAIHQVVPLPPFAEQHRIVAKVDELMTLCDRLEAARANREATRDRLTAASLARLNKPDPEAFQSDARFALDALPALTSRPDQIKQLRQTILNLAVRGKLVAQDANEEPASELLNRIATKFERAVRDGVLNKPKPVKPIFDDDQLFPLPPRWAIARFNQVASIQSNLVDPKRYREKPHIAPDNIESWTARLLPYVSIGEAGVFSSKHLFSSGAILYSKIRPNLAKVTRVEFDGLCSADMYPIHALIDADFLVKFMITQAFVSQAVSEDNRVAMPKINQSALSDILVPVPPLAEQRCIVAKVDALMALCDQLEASLTAAAETRRRLLDALLAEALTPVEDREMEAAE
ncbi:type I restriction enzyme S subunit [Rhodopseudomonas faecalis]|uniref:Type I restriction enzyme S subunit n=1 Tax=Rhodopseudomonas faecalis TaxID=99655 RepID=A0A318TDA2_9BRAD|nr:restriction endonuclease subunit S [Rhodopseudomonas faecalis]PYF02553.1 type I restriction enzyme S subunit [Rhodopseudomonas faecalis]